MERCVDVESGGALAHRPPLHVRHRPFRNSLPEYNTAAWLQDDWAGHPRLTLNLGVRYDLAMNVYANEVILPPIITEPRPNDTNNFQPRFGFAYTLTDRPSCAAATGGTTATSSRTRRPDERAGEHGVVDIPNDGRPDFPANPFNGPWPTREQLEQRFCSTAQTPRCIRRDTRRKSVSPIAEFTQMPYSHQASIGLQRQVASTMSVEADYVYTGGRDERPTRGHNGTTSIMTYDPATGVNYPYTDISRRPFPEWGPIYMNVMEGRSNYHGLADRLHQTVEQPLAGVGHLYAVGAL